MEMNLKKLRLLNKKSQKEIAESIQVTAPAYFKYENGDAKPTIENLCKLADLYNVSVDYILGRNIDEFGYLSNDEKSLITMYRNLNYQNKAILLGEAKAFSISQE